MKKKNYWKSFYYTLSLIVNIIVYGIGGLAAVLYGVTVLMLSIVTLRVIGIFLGIGAALFGTLSLAILVNVFKYRRR